MHRCTPLQRHPMPHPPQTQNQPWIGTHRQDYKLSPHHPSLFAPFLAFRRKTDPGFAADLATLEGVTHRWAQIVDERNLSSLGKIPSNPAVLFEPTLGSVNGADDITQAILMHHDLMYQFTHHDSIDEIHNYEPMHEMTLRGHFNVT